MNFAIRHNMPSIETSQFIKSNHVENKILFSTLILKNKEMFRRTEAVILKVEAQAIRAQIVTVKYCCISGAIFKLVMHSNVTWMLISTVISGENNG